MSERTQAEKYDMARRYLRWSTAMREFHDAAFEAVADVTGMRGDDLLTDKAAQDRAVQHAPEGLIDRMFATMLYWYTSLYVAVEAWAELKLHDEVIETLLSNELHVGFLKRLRNGVCHFQHGLDDSRFADFFDRNAQVTTWAIRVHNALIAYFAERPALS